MSSAMPLLVHNERRRGEISDVLAVEFLHPRRQDSRLWPGFTACRRLAYYEYPYDREAVAQGGADRIIVADYTLADGSRLPRERMRLATLHLMLEGDADFELRLVTATTPDGRVIDASITLQIPEERAQ